MVELGVSRTFQFRNNPLCYNVCRSASYAMTGPEVRAADSDVDNVANGFSRVTLPGAGPDAIREGRHPAEDIVNLEYNVFSINDNGCGLGRTQGHMQDRPLLGDIDHLATKHGVDSL